MNPIIESINRYNLANQWKKVNQGLEKQLEFPEIQNKTLPLTGKIRKCENGVVYKFSVLIAEKKKEYLIHDKNEAKKRLFEHAKGLVNSIKKHAMIENVKLIECGPAKNEWNNPYEAAIIITVEARIIDNLKVQA